MAGTLEITTDKITAVRKPSDARQPVRNHNGSGAHRGPGRVAFARFAVPATPLTSWTSPEHRIGFIATQLVPSWTARTPPGTWIEVELQVRLATGELSKWYVMGHWAEHDEIRTSFPGQGDE